MAHPTINVIVPVLNGADFLPLCLEGLRRQTYPGKILPVVINDGSTDDTSAAACSFKEIMLIEQENRGRSAARNHGIANSSAPVIAFTDADCIPQPDWLATLMSRLSEMERRGVVSGAMVIPPDSNLWQRLDHQAWAHSTGPTAPAGPTLFGSTANMILYRTVFNEVGGFDSRLIGSEDSDLAFRIHRAGYQNYFEPKAVVVHNHPRRTLNAFLRQRYNYGRWTIQTILKHKPLPPYSWIFPNHRLALALLSPGYALSATVFTVLRNLPHDSSAIWLSPLHLMGRMVEYIGAVGGCSEYRRLFSKDVVPGTTQEGLS